MSEREIKVAANLEGQSTELAEKSKADLARLTVADSNFEDSVAGSETDTVIACSEELAFPQFVEPKITMPKGIASARSLTTRHNTAVRATSTSDVAAILQKPRLCMLKETSPLFWLLLAFLSLFGAGYWSFCINKLSAAITYGTQTSRRYSRLCTSMLGLLYNPLVLAVLLLLCISLARIVIMYGAINSFIQGLLWIFCFTACFIPFFTARSYYRFFLKLMPLTETPNSKRTALIIAACHLFPLLLVVFGMAMDLLSSFFQIQFPFQEPGRFSIMAFFTFLASTTSQMVAFFTLKRFFDRIGPVKLPPLPKGL